MIRAYVYKKLKKITSDLVKVLDYRKWTCYRAGLQVKRGAQQLSRLVGQNVCLHCLVWAYSVSLIQTTTNLSVHAPSRTNYKSITNLLLLPLIKALPLPFDLNMVSLNAILKGRFVRMNMSQSLNRIWLKLILNSYLFIRSK